jgi:hypothetical protein
MIQIDSGYGEPSPEAATKRPAELTVPLKAAFSARSAITSLLEQAARNAFSRPDPSIRVMDDRRYVRFSLHAHVGNGAPSGWVLSNPSQQDLLDQLDDNVAPISRVRSWFSPDLSCG